MGIQKGQVQQQWIRFRGPHGGSGWKSTKTGRVLYQKERPNKGEHHAKRPPRKAPRVYKREIPSHKPHRVHTRRTKQGKHPTRNPEYRQMIATRHKRKRHGSMESAGFLAFAPETNGDRIDRALHIIKGVKILGLESRNPAFVLGLSEKQFGDAANKPYGYTLEALKEAQGLYEGSKVFIDHTLFRTNDDGRRVVQEEDSQRTDDLIGWLTDVHVVEGQGLFGNLNYLEHHPFTPRLLEIAERNPNVLGMSHEALFGEPKVINGKIYLTKIMEVSRVALISDRPGTTSNLFESEVRTMKLADILQTAAKDAPGRDVLEHLVKLTSKASPKPTSGWVAELDDTSYEEMMTDMDGADIDVDANEGAEDDKTDPVDHIQQGLMAAICMAVEDADVETLKKLLKILGLSDSLSETATGDGKAKPAPAKSAPAKSESDSEESDDEDSEDDEKPKAQESSMTSKELLSECLQILQKANLTPKTDVLESMLNLPTKESREHLAKTLAAFATPENQSPPPPETRSKPLPNKAAESAAANSRYAKPGSLVEAMRRPNAVPISD